MSSKSELTRTQCNNLAKLATYLEGLPADYSHFSMDVFIKGGDEEKEDGNESSYVEYALTNGGVGKHGCGTVACAIGHGPAAGIFFRKVELSSDSTWDEEECDWLPIKEPNWDKYSQRFAPLDTGLWAWFFGSGWEDEDNTHQGAAARIRYVLDRNSIPEAFFKWVTVAPEYVTLYAKYLVNQPAAPTSPA